MGLSTSRPSTDSSNNFNIDSLTSFASALVDKSSSTATHRTYERAIKLCTNFLERLSQNTLKPFPASSHSVMLFVAHCYDSNLAASTILTYMSALSYFHKIKGFPDPTQSFVIRKCLQGYQKERATNDQRKPITLNILC